MSARFLEIYNSLPPEAQQTLLEKHLAGLLDVAPNDKSKKVILAATQLQTKYNKVSELDLRAKKRQIGHLLDELAVDAKIAIVPERSNRDELLSEIIHGLLSWLNTIWSVVYEQNVYFATAHRCLLYAAEALIQLTERSNLGGCRCTFRNMPVEFSLKDRDGKTLKHFSLRDPEKMDQILLWIWRDLFVSLLTMGSQHDRASVPIFLEEIQDVLGFIALERLLRGGGPSTNDDDESWNDDEIESEEDDEESCFDDDEDFCPEEDEDDFTDGTDNRCSCKLHAKYWGNEVNMGRIRLRECVDSRLSATFRLVPSLRLYRAITSVNSCSESSMEELYEILGEVAADSPDNLVAALDIYIYDYDFDMLVELLQNHIHLLRPRDMDILLRAVAMLVESPENKLAFSILEAELEDSFQAIYAVIRSCFTRMDEPNHKVELLQILKLKSGSSARKTRVESWVENVIFTSNSPMVPMAFAAMMMGLAVLPGADEVDDSDVLNYVDPDSSDTDFDNLRDEFRPDLKSRFNGWSHLANVITGGKPLLLKLFSKAIDMMPFLRGPDIVNEMVVQLKRKGPGKHHVHEALSCLGTFVKLQRKKISLAVEKKQRNAASASSQTSSSGSTTANKAKKNPTVTRARATQDPSNDPGPSSKPITLKVPGGLEDVD